MTSKSDAYRLANIYAQQTVKAFEPPTRIDKEFPDADPVACSDETDPGKNTPVSIQVNYKVTGFEEDISTLQKKFIDYWSHQGWSLRFGKIVEQQAIMQSPTGYTLNLSEGASAKIGTLAGASPCFIDSSATSG